LLRDRFFWYGLHTNFHQRLSGEAFSNVLLHELSKGKNASIDAIVKNASHLETTKKIGN
jgi:hypothetical protein